jgi:hypothetical protein
MKSLIKALGLIIPLTITGCVQEQKEKEEIKEFETSPRKIEEYIPIINRIRTYKEEKTILFGIQYTLIDERDATPEERKKYLNQDLASK